MRDLLKALEDSRPQIEAALENAERELEDLQQREQQLIELITRAKAALGHEPDPRIPVAPQTGTELAERLTLHEAIRRVLHTGGGDWMTVKDIAHEVNNRKLYEKRDGSPVEPNQIHARTKNYESLFEKDGPRIRLRDEDTSEH